MLSFLERIYRVELEAKYLVQKKTGIDRELRNFLFFCIILEVQGLTDASELRLGLVLLVGSKTVRPSA